MQKLMIVAAIVALGACNRSAATNNAAANKAAPAANAAAPAPMAPVNTAAAPVAPAAGSAASFPPHFPGTGLLEQGGGCIAYLGLTRQAGASPAGRDDPIMEQAQGQWEAALTVSDIPDMEWRQLVASSFAVLDDVPAPQRDAAAAWCVENAPEVDPEG